MEVVGRKIVLTRKPHRCFGCAREFPKRTKMERSCTIDGDNAWTCYLCLTCVEVGSNMQYGDTFGYADLRDDALELERERDGRYG
jgi:hypothetical protein